MTTPTFFRGGTLLALASVAVAASCSDPEGTASDSGPVGEEPTSSVSADRQGDEGAPEESRDGGAAETEPIETSRGTDGTDDGDSEEPEEWVSPLAEFMGWGFDGFSEEDLRKERQIEELVAECMADEGFEYTPVDPTSWEDSSGGTGPMSLPRDEFVEQYGYGISTLSGEQLVDESAMKGPNQEYIESLSPSAQKEYDLTMYGDPSTGHVGSEERDTGCDGEAREEVYGPVPEPDDTGRFDALEDDINAVSERVENDPRIAEALDEWSACMADSGYPGMSDLADPIKEVEARLAAALGDDAPNNRGDHVIVEGNGGVAARPMTVDGDGEVVDVVGDSDVDPEMLEELRDFERQIASAAYRCEMSYEEERQQVQAEIENEFIDANREELERYRDAIAAGEILPQAGGVG